jgi:hypothetical protein
MMYKLSVGHIKIFCGFFASTVGFRQNSTEFFAKPAGNRWPNFQKIQPNYRQIRSIIWLIRPNFVFSKIFYSFHMSTVFQSNFSKFFKIRRNRWDVIFHCPLNSVTLLPHRVHDDSTDAVVGPHIELQQRQSRAHDRAPCRRVADAALGAPPACRPSWGTASGRGLAYHRLLADLLAGGTRDLPA